MDGSGLFGTNAPLRADISLLTGIVVALLLTVGVALAVRRRYEAHRWVQSTAVALNIVQVLVVMVGSFQRSATPGIPAKLGEPYYLAATVHAAVGSATLLLGAFVALRGNQLVPRLFRFNNYRLWMRSAYSMYMLTTLLGVWVYFTWYAAAPQTAVAAPDVLADAETAAVPMANFVYNPVALVIPAGTTVVWTNQDGAPHTATSDDGALFRSDTLSTGQSFSFRFDTPGEYPYYCELHGSPGGVDMAGTITVVAPGEVPQQVAAPVVAPSPAAPTAPTPLPLPPALFEQPAGTAAFRDQQAYGDALELELLGLDTDEESLAAFLVSADGATAVPLGALARDGDAARLSYAAPGAGLLAGRFPRLVVTAGADRSAPTGRPVYESTLPPEAFARLSPLLVNDAGAPGYAVMLRRQADELARHVGFVAEAQAAGDGEGMRRHAEHVYNLIAGSRDAHFGDLNGDGRSQNPGDGFGLLANGDQAGYIGATRAAATAAAEAQDATQSIAAHAGHVVISAGNMEVWAVEARDLAQQLAGTADPSAAGEAAARLKTLGRWLERGEDLDGDGLIAPVAGEGGGLVAYQHAMYMAGFGLYPAAQ